MADCGGELRDRLGLSADEAKDILETLRNYSGSAEDRIAYAKAKSEGLTREAALRDFRAKFNAVKLADAQAHVEPFRGRYSAWEGIRSFLIGSDKPIENARLSVDAGIQERTNVAIGGLMRDLRRAAGDDVFGWMADKEFDKEVGRAKWMLRDDSAGPYRPMDTPWGQKAVEVARAYDKYHESGRVGLNNVGADIGDNVTYVMPQSHDPAKLLQAGKEAWIDATLPFLSQEKTFARVGALAQRTDQRAALGQIWQKITDGTWGTYSDSRIGKNLADAVSAARELVFKDYDSFYAYNEQFGRGSILDGMTHHIQNQQRNIALMERMGTNPGRFAQKLIGTYGTDARPPDGWLGTPSIKPSAETLADTLLGLDNVPGDPRWANFGRNVRRVQDMAHLGSSLASQVPDIATIGARAQFNGMSWLSAHGEAMTAFLRGRSKGELRLIAEDWGIFADSVLGNQHRRFGAFDSPDGTMSRAVERFYKLSGMTRWDDSQREGFGFFLLHNLTRFVDGGQQFTDLDPALRESFTRYGVTAADWGKLTREMIAVTEGRRFLDTNSIPKDVAAKLRTMFISESSLAMPLPSLYERAFMLRGSKPGTYVGELARFFARYKGVSITMLTRVLPQVAQQGRIGGVAAFMAEAAALGYLSYTARELMNGRTVPDPLNGTTIMQSLAKGGGLGYAGDLFISMGQDMNKSAVDVLSGVTGSTVSNVWRIGQQIIDEARHPERKHDIGAKVFRLVMSETPFVNLWYSKLLLNYLFSWHVQEAMNPGYLNRMERRVKREQGNQYMVPPSSVIQRGGGFR